MENEAKMGYKKYALSQRVRDLLKYFMDLGYISLYVGAENHKSDVYPHDETGYRHKETTLNATEYSIYINLPDEDSVKIPVDEDFVNEILPVIPMYSAYYVYIGNKITDSSVPLSWLYNLQKLEVEKETLENIKKDEVKEMNKTKKLDCAKTLDFLKAMNRMCNENYNDCPACCMYYTDCDCSTYENITEKNIADVQEWIDNHNYKTLREDFIERFPKLEDNSDFFENNQPMWFYNHLNDVLYDDCDKAWNMECKEEHSLIDGFDYDYEDEYYEDSI